MKILLLGECSNMHWTLAQSLRQLGHDVTVASDGSRWMNNQRDINLARDGYNLKGTIKYILNIYKNFRTFKGYDIVQIKNPLFLDLKADKNLFLYKYLKKNNNKVFLGAFGTDFYWINTCFDRKTFRYSDYFIGDIPTNITMAHQHAKEWFGKEKKYLNEYIANTCDGIIACLYEYYAAYKKEFSEKLIYISEPVNTSLLEFQKKEPFLRKIKFFIGIQKDRHQLKGTDLLLKGLLDIEKKYTGDIQINRAESIPNDQYLKLMSDSDIILDQIYSYTPGMNALSAMALGLIAVSGAEPEMYKLLHETQNKPIINILPNTEAIYNEIENIIINKDNIPQQSVDSRKFIEEHHDSMKIAVQYLNFWSRNRF